MQDLSILSKYISNDIETLKQRKWDENLKTEILNRIFIFNSQFDNILMLLSKHPKYRIPLEEHMYKIQQMNKLYNEDGNIDELEHFDDKFIYLTKILSDWDKDRIKEQWELQMKKFNKNKK